MSSKMKSRAYAQGKVKALRQLKQTMALHIEATQPPRNAVARAMLQRNISSAAGKHVRSQGAQRRADRVTLQKSWQTLCGQD